MGNLTACSSQDPRNYNTYCEFEKEFEIESMKLAVSAPMADTLSAGLIVFLLVIIGGICLLFVYL